MNSPGGRGLAGRGGSCVTQQLRDALLAQDAASRCCPAPPRPRQRLQRAQQQQPGSRAGRELRALSWHTAVPRALQAAAKNKPGQCGLRMNPAGAKS